MKAILLNDLKAAMNKSRNRKNKNVIDLSSFNNAIKEFIFEVDLLTLDSLKAATHRSEKVSLNRFMKETFTEMTEKKP